MKYRAKYESEFFVVTFEQRFVYDDSGIPGLYGFGDVDLVDVTFFGVPLEITSELETALLDGVDTAALDWEAP